MNNANQNTFDFSKYLATPDQLSMPVEKKQNIPTGDFDLKNYIVKEPETNFQAGVRNIARSASRVGESIAGFPGDTVQLVKKGGEFLSSKMPDFLKGGSNQEPNFIQKAGRKLLDAIPTSDSLKEDSEKATDGYTTPQNDYEEFSDKVSSLLPMIVNPTKAFSSATGFLRNVGMSIAKATAVKGSGAGVKMLGGSELQAAAVETGVLFLTSFFNAKSAEQFVSEQMEKAKASIPPNAMLNTQRLDISLNAVENELRKGILTNTKSEVLKSVTDLQAKTKVGAMEVREVEQSVRDINEKLTSKKLFDELGTTERKLLSRRYNLLKTAVHDEMAAYGQTNPEFYKQWYEANRSYQTVAESKRASNWIQSKIGKIPVHIASSIAIDLFTGSPKTTGALLTSYGGVKLFEVANRVFNDKNLRKHYMNVVKEASAENLPGMIKNLDLLDKGINKNLKEKKDKPKSK